MREQMSSRVTPLEDAYALGQRKYEKSSKLGKCFDRIKPWTAWRTKKVREEVAEVGNWFGGYAGTGSLFSVIVQIVPGTAFALGCWQTYRLQWKLGVIASLEERLHATPIDFPINNLETLPSLEYRRVRMKGVFLHDREFILRNRGRFDPGVKGEGHGSLLSNNELSSHGAHVITPFKISRTNLVILVNRGWVSPSLIDRNSRLQSESKGEVTIEAIVRKSESRPQFVGNNIPEKGIWFYKDLEEMGDYYGTAPILVDATYESTVPGGPIGGQTNINVRNEHLNYLITWFSLSAVTLAMWIARFRPR